MRVVFVGQLLIARKVERDTRAQKRDHIEKVYTTHTKSMQKNRKMLGKETKNKKGSKAHLETAPPASLCGSVSTAPVNL